MAIAVDATSSGGSGSTSTLTFSHTCSGTNRILFVGVRDAVAGSSNITGVTYNGTAMTQITSGIQCPGDRYVTLWYLIAPATGANDVVVSLSAATNVSAAAASYTGAKQTDQPDASGTDSASSVTTLATSLTSIADNCWMVMVARSNGATCTAGASTTERVTSAAGTQLFDSNAAITPAGSRTLTIDNAGSVNLGVVKATFAPAAATTNANFLAFM